MPQTGSRKSDRLLEDEPRARDAIAQALDGAGLGVAGATASAEAALRAAAAAGPAGPPPAALVTDTDPAPDDGMDGLALAAEARRRWPGLGVVYFTSRPSKLHGHVLRGRDRFLPKPVMPAAVVRAVRGLMGAASRPGALRMDSRHDRPRSILGAAALALGAALASMPVGGAHAQPGPAQPRQGPSPLPPALPERIEPEPRQRRGGPGTPGGMADGTTAAPRGGVVRPPQGVDPGMQAPVSVPDPGTTRVIPSPGTPGGDPRVQPR